jgi:hypothetical protein
MLRTRETALSLTPYNKRPRGWPRPQTSAIVSYAWQRPTRGAAGLWERFNGGFWTLLDQGAISLGTFLVNVQDRETTRGRPQRCFDFHRQYELNPPRFGVTAHPTAEWIANQLTEACGWEQIPRYLIRDRDGAYGEIFIRRVRSIGIRDRPTSPRSPWQNAYAERLIGSIRRECLDHIVVFGERHLRHVLLSYMDYYNGARTHLSLNKDARISRAAEAAGRILCRPILGGPHHQYARADLR